MTYAGNRRIIDADSHLIELDDFLALAAGPSEQSLIPPMDAQGELPVSPLAIERARELGKGLQIPVRPRLLSRTRRTRAQSGLDARERRKNTRAAFSSHQTGFSHVALVDDVMTTGATLAECTRTLKRAGVSCVSAWVAARANIGLDRTL